MKMQYRASSGFTIIELAIAITIIDILLKLALPSYTSSIAEHRALGFVAAIKTDIEWARAQALSRNKTVELVFPNDPDCSTWVTKVAGTTLNDHKMTSAELAASYKNVSCAVTDNAAPSFNTFGLNPKGCGCPFEATITASGTSRQWLLKVDGTGEVRITIAQASSPVSAASSSLLNSSSTGHGHDDD